MILPNCRRGAFSRPIRGLALLAGTLLGLCVLGAPPARGASGTLTIQPNASATADTYLTEDNTSENNETDTELRLKATADQQDRHPVIRIPLTGLAGKTILRAWLELQQFAASSSTPIDARVYPVTESWDEAIATWATRDRVLILDTPWSTPGGTHSAFWTDRRLVSSTTNAGPVRWEVGPLVEAWNTGTLANNGFLMTPVTGGDTRELSFVSSDDVVVAERPKLVIQYTTEAPAIRSGTAEIQPRSVRAGSLGIPLTVWLDVDALGATTTGAATGFDVLNITHAGALVVTGVDRMVVDGSVVSTSLVNFTEDGQSVSFRFPRVRIRGQVQIDFRADVLAPDTPLGVDLPITVDDATTPGAWAQSLWPGNGDRVAGNGDDWILKVASTPPVSIDLLPAADTLVNFTCLQMSLVGRDALGDVFPVQPDSVRVFPSSAGTVGPNLSFCAMAQGTATVVAYSGALSDTSVLQVLPEQIAQIHGIALLDRLGTGTSEMTPGDRMFLDVTLSDGDGLQDVDRVVINLRHPGWAASPEMPAYGATFTWVRGGSPTWSLVEPSGTSWKVKPSQCSFDESSNTTGPAVARLAFVVGSFARASASGEWSAEVSVSSASPPRLTSSTLAGLNATVVLTLVATDTLGAFSPGRAGANGLPLAAPPGARLRFSYETNAACSLEVRASDMVGTTTSTDTLRVGAPQNRLHGSTTSTPSDGGAVDTSWSALAVLPALEDETPRSVDLWLWIDHPVSIPAQDYLGSLYARLDATPPGSTSGEEIFALRASVAEAGLAAQLALAEVLPHSVTAGTPAQPITVHFRPFFQGTDTGVDHLQVSVPAGYAVPVVTVVQVAGAPVTFQDYSVAGLVEVQLDSLVTSNQLIQLQLNLDAPTALDFEGSDFVAVFDDRSTSVPPQTATEGNANGLADGNNWTIAVQPGPLAAISVSPGQALMFRDSVATFSATGRDALGHPLAVTMNWSAEGGIGTVGATSGVFTATTPGTGRLIAQNGGLADTAEVTVLPARAVFVRSVSGPASVYQGQTGAAFTLRIENSAPTDVGLDTLRLSFSRGTSGDANGEFLIVSAPALPAFLSPGSNLLTFTADVDASALLAPLSVQAMASGIETASGIRLRDIAADTALAVGIVAGGVELTAFQTPGPASPGAREVKLLALRAVNRYPEARSLKSLNFTNLTTGSGDQDQLDAELGQMRLYVDDGDGVFEPGQDFEELSTVALGGALRFAPLDVAFAPLSTRWLFAVADLPVLMRDGDVLDLSVGAAADGEFDLPVTYRNTWPVEAPGGFMVDGMTAAQIAARTVGPAVLHPGSVDQLAFDARLPANGYMTDVLTRLGVINTGSAAAGTDLSRLRAWADDGDEIFSPVDSLLGELAYTGGGRWQLTGLNRAVPLAGRRIYVTVDAAPLAGENATVRLALPSAPDPGVGMASGNSGPLDQPVTNSAQLTVSDIDRVSIVALPLSGGTTRPGEDGRPLLDLVLSNNYATPRTLTTLVVTNAGSGPGSAAEQDGEIRLLTLRLDGNDNGMIEDPATDPVLATSFFQGGKAAFTGLGVSLGALAARRLFVTGDISRSGARDGDLLGATVAGPNDLDFAEPSTASGLWPLDSGARWTVDGFTAAQVTDLGAPPATVGPGDGPVLAMDVLVPRNGYASDLLRGFRLVNLGNAGTGDISQMQLWRDGGDGVFSGGGDDLLLGPLTSSGPDWTSPLLSVPVSAGGKRLFVSIDVAAAAAESAVVRLAIPVNGVQYESANDGPLDTTIINTEAILITSSPLLATLDVPRASTVGQSVRVAMAVRNASAETVRGITPPALVVTGSATLSLVSGPAPASFDLAPAASDTFVWQYSADGIGEARFAGGADGTGDPSGLPRRALGASSNLHRVYQAAQQLDLTPVQTMPIRVNRGQTGVVPFILTLVHPGGEGASNVRVDRLRVRLEDESGAPIVPSSLLDRVEVNEGTNVYLVKTGLESSGSEIDLPLATPAAVTATQPTTLSLRLDISAGTMVPAFRVVIDDSSRFSAQDVTNGAPVTVKLGSGSFPLRSGVANVVAEATELNVTALAQDTVRASRGTVGATLMRFRLESPGVGGISAAARVASMAVALTDSAGADRGQPGTVVGELRLRAGATVLARRTLSGSDGDTLTLTLSPPLELAANTPLDVVLEADISPAAPFERFGSRLLDSTWVDARDANTRVSIPVRYFPDTLRGGWVTIETPADSLRVFGTPMMPPVVRIGEPNLLVIEARLRHPGGTGTGRVRVDSLVFECLDDLRRPLVPASYLSRLRVLWNGGEVANVTSLPNSGSRVGVGLPTPMLEPGDTASVEVRIDVNAAAPAGMLELVVPMGEFYARDANSLAPTSLGSEPGSNFPLHSNLGRLTSPARDLAVSLASVMPAVLAADGRPVRAGSLMLRNADAAGTGDIPIDHLRIRASDRTYASLSIGAAATRIEAWVAGSLWAASAPLTPDSVTATLESASPLSVPPGITASVEFRMVTRSGASVPSLRLGVDRDDIGVIQPSSALLAINVRPEAGLALPMWTETGGLAEASIEASYSNFPNPFAAGREATTIAYFMPTAGRVNLRILSPGGETVVALLDNAPRAAGLHQTDVWTGRNGRGDLVYNGVYIADLEVRFDGGGSRRLRRKVAVVR